MFLGQIEVTSEEAASYVDKYQEQLPAGAGVYDRLFAYKSALAKGKSEELKDRIAVMEAGRVQRQAQLNSMHPKGPGGVRDMLNVQNLIDYYTSERDYAQAQLSEIQNAQREGNTSALNVEFKLPDTTKTVQVASAADVWSGAANVASNSAKELSQSFAQRGASLFFPGVPVPPMAARIGLDIFTLGLPELVSKFGGHKPSGVGVMQTYTVPGEQIPIPHNLPVGQQLLYVPSIFGPQPIVTKVAPGEGKTGLKGLEETWQWVLIPALVIYAIAMANWRT